MRIALLAVIFMLGTQLVDPRVSKRAYAAALALTGICSGLIPALGSQRPRLARWLALASTASAIFVFGVLARTIVEGFRR